MRRLGAVAILTALLLPCLAAAQTPPERVELENEKLRQEIRKLDRENDEAARLFSDLLDYLPFATVLVAVFGALFPIMKELRERREQRQEEIDQQKLETRRRFDEQFAAAIANLGSDKEAVRVSGAVSLTNFLRDEYQDFHEQVYRVVCANLSVEHTDVVQRFLGRAFERAVRGHIKAATEAQLAPELEFARCALARVDLSGLDLAGADVAFARLKGANLSDCNLHRAKGYEGNLEGARLSRSTLSEIRFHKAVCKGADFHEANLTSAELRNADLEKAEFYRARMQSAHLDGSILRGARFDQANLKDTFFGGAVFDDVALRSIVNAAEGTWRKAHFDDDVAATLERFANRAGRARTRKSTGTAPPG